MILYVAPDAPDIFLWYNPVRKDTLLYIMTVQPRLNGHFSVLTLLFKCTYFTVQPWLNGKICLLYG